MAHGKERHCFYVGEIAYAARDSRLKMPNAASCEKEMENSLAIDVCYRIRK